MIRLHRTAGSIAGIWRETAATLSQYFEAVSLCALLGFACSDLIGWLVAGASTPETSALVSEVCRRYFGAQPELIGAMPLWFPAAAAYCIWDAINLPAVFALLIECVVCAFVRGALTWVGLHSVRRVKLSASRLWRATLARWPALVMGSMVYGAAIMLCISGVDGVMKEFGLEPSVKPKVEWVPLPSVYVPAVQRDIGQAIIWQMIPDPGQPFGEWLAWRRSSLGRVEEPKPAACVDTAALVYELNRGQTGRHDLSRCRDELPPVISVAPILGLLALVAADTLLRFRTAAALLPGCANRGRGAGAWVGWLRGSVGAGARSFGAVTAHICVFRIGSAVALGLFVALPVILMEGRGLPLAMSLGGMSAGAFWVYTAASFLTAMGSALVGALLIAFTAVYDARLYEAVRTAAPTAAPHLSGRLVAVVLRFPPLVSLWRRTHRPA